MNLHLINLPPDSPTWKSVLGLVKKEDCVVFIDCKSLQGEAIFFVNQLACNNTYKLEGVTIHQNTGVTIPLETIDYIKFVQLVDIADKVLSWY